MSAAVLAFACGLVSPAATTVPAAPTPEPAPSDAADTYQPGWDDEAPLPPPATHPSTPAATPMASPEPTLRSAGRGKGLLIGAGALAGVGLIANAIRAYVVTGPCQSDAQTYCTGPWSMATVFAWGPNEASLVLAGVGGSLLGRDHATYEPERHRARARGMKVAGAVLVATGALVNVLLRVAWFTDWVTPEGAELFDFSRPGHAIGYYGGLQLSSMMIATGIGSLVYASARPRKRNLALTPSGYGLQLSGRF